MAHPPPQAGCEAARDLFIVRECSEPVGGGFDVEEGVRVGLLSTTVQHWGRIINTHLHHPQKIVLCHNHLGSLNEVACVMKHELVHAYDQCTAKGLDWANMDDRACSEVYLRTWTHA